MFQLIKSAILDVSTYIKIGIDVEDIEDCIETTVKINKSAVVRPISSLPMYEIKTLYVNDEDVIHLMEKIINDLDVLVVEYTEKKFMDN